MKLILARNLAEGLMQKHELVGWTFDFDEAEVTFGKCHISRKKITLSRKLVELNEERHVRNTILHEIAHALAPPTEMHGPEWRRVALSIGCNGSRTYSREVILPNTKWYSECPNCLKKQPVRRRTKGTACGVCCKLYNGGRWSRHYILVYKETEQ